MILRTGLSPGKNGSEIIKKCHEKNHKKIIKKSKNHKIFIKKIKIFIKNAEIEIHKIFNKKS